MSVNPHFEVESLQDSRVISIERAIVIGFHKGCVFRVSTETETVFLHLFYFKVLQTLIKDKIITTRINEGDEGEL